MSTATGIAATDIRGRSGPGPFPGDGCPRELETLLYGVLHDLKAPLNAILLTAELLFTRVSHLLNDEARADLARVARTAAHGERMLIDLFELIHLTSTAEAIRAIDLDALLAEVIDVLHPTLRARRIRITSGALPVVWGRPTKLRHVLDNLLSNAVKYVPEGRGEITVTGHRAGDWSVLRVRDNGIGIPREYHRVIFEMFGQAPAPSAPANGELARGTGIGLAIVRQIVEDHGGTVHVESAPGAGSSFVVHLPAIERR